MPRAIDNHPDAMRVALLANNGTPVPPFDARSIDVFLGDLPKLIIPRGGVFGQYIDLDCIGNPYAPSGHSCYYGYRVEQDGEYRVVVTYVIVDGDSTEALSDTAIVFVRP